MSKLVKRCGFYLALLIIVAALLTSLIRALTPWVTQYQSNIEHHLTKILGNKVVIGQMETGWYWLQPVIKVTNLAILNGKKPILDAHQVMVGINLLGSLWNWRLEPGLLYLDQMHLIIRQTDKDWTVEGFSLEDSQNSLFSVLGRKQLLALILAQEKLIVKHISAEVYLKDGTLIPIKQFNFIIAKSFGRYKLKADLAIDELRPTSVVIMASLAINPDNLSRISGDVYFKLANFQMAQWREFLGVSRFQILHAWINGEVWLNLKKSNLINIQSKLSVKQLDTLDTQTKKHFLADGLSGNLAWSQKASAWQLSGDQLKLKLNGKQWPINEFLMDYDEAHQTWKMYVRHVLLQPLLAQNFNWPALMKPLIKAKLRGVLEETEIQVKQGKLVYVLGHFDSLGWNTFRDKYPGVTNLSGLIYWQPDSGRIALESKNSVIKPKDKPKISFDELNAEVKWKKINQGWQLNLERLVVNRPDLLASFTGLTTFNDTPVVSVTATPSEGVSVILPIHANLEPAVGSEPPLGYKDIGTIQLKGGLSAKNAKQWLQYLPSKGLKPKLYAWLQRDIKRIDNLVLDLNVDGRTADFPFDEGDSKIIPGIFKINAHLSGVDLIFAPGWPLTRDIEAYLYFDKRTLNTDVVSAKLENIHIDEVNLNLRDMGLDKDTLLVHGKVHTTGTKALNYVLASPLGTKLALFKLFTIEGMVGLDLQLEAPLYPGNDTILAVGDLVFHENDLAVNHRVGQVQLNKLLGHIDFTEEGVSDSHLNAKIMDAPASIEIASIKTKTPGTLVNIKGKLSVKKLQKTAYGALFNRMKGKIGLETSLSISNVPGDLNSAHIMSTMEGVEILWPSPLGKPMDIVKPFLADFDFNPVKGTKVQMSYGDLIVNATKHEHAPWAIQVDEAMIAGKLGYQPSTNKLSANLSRLYWPNTNLFASELGENIGPIKVKDLPNVDLKIQKFRYKKWDLGSLDCQAHTKNTSWVIDACSLTTSTYAIQAEGEWSQKDSVNHSSADFNIAVSDLASTLTRWGIMPVVSAKHGEIQVRAQWPGAFHDFSLASVSGSSFVMLKNGEITHLDAATEDKLSLGKLFSILNLQTLPRRLKLDFSDLSHKGYVFDVFRGNFAIAQGTMNTADSVIDGPVASASIRGSLDIVHQLYDMQIKIAPHLTSSLPVIATITGGPLVGAATWVATKIINQGMQKFSAYRYVVTGPWKNPVIKQTNIFKDLDKKLLGIDLL